MIRRITAALVLAALSVAALPATARAFDVADVLAAPFPVSLAASSDGTVLVWDIDASGVRNLYTNAGGTVHAVTHYTTDDGADNFFQAVTPGDDAVIYCRGNAGDEGTGADANPLSLIPPPQRTLYIVPIAGGEPVKLAEGCNGAFLSPKGDAVAYTTSEGEFSVVSFSKDASGAFVAGKAETLAIHGSVGNPVWSPDGSKIALTNARGDHSFIVIYTPSTSSYVYATPDFTQDDQAAWSPDGTHVAFVRTPGAQIGETIYDLPTFEASTASSTPWSIWVADAASGKAHRVWTAQHGIGHEFYPTMSAAQLWWLQGGEIAFPWEGDGWQHIYAVNAAGGPAKRLTSGAYDVESVAESLDKTKLLLATNEGDLDVRHLWSVGLDGHTHQLTHGPANQWFPTPLANGGIAYVDAGYAAPPEVTIGGAPPKTLIGVATPANYPLTQMVKPQLVTFTAPDGLTIHAQLLVPRRAAGKIPAIVFTHGGPPRQMLGGFHYMEAYTHLYEMNQYLVSKGFAVLSINYRLGIMYGYKFRNPAHGGWHGGSEYQDVLAGAKWLQKQPNVDPNRIGIYGLSYGGLLTALGLARNSDIFKVGADFAGVHDWPTSFDHDFGKPVGTPEQRKIAHMSTAEGYLDTWKSPVFISQGDDDRNVAFSQSVDLVTKLRDRGVTVETLLFTNETHENSVIAHLAEQYRAAEAFLAKYLHPVEPASVR
jgi:dipeptidyl aminopeptidase/acylaminoacyl peptidase